MSSYEFWDELGKIFNAVVAYQEKNVEFNKRFISPWIRLGNVFDKQDRKIEAIEAYQKAIEIDPLNAQNWYELGNVHFKMKSHDLAAEAFRKAVELDEAFGWAYNNLALTLVSQGQYDEAIPLYGKGIDLLQDAKDKAVAWNRLGNAYRKLNHYEKALEAFHKADELDKENGGFRDTLDEESEGPSLVQEALEGSTDAACEPVSPLELIVAENDAQEIAAAAADGETKVEAPPKEVCEAGAPEAVEAKEPVEAVEGADASAPAQDAPEAPAADAAQAPAEDNQVAPASMEAEAPVELAPKAEEDNAPETEEEAAAKVEVETFTETLPTTEPGTEDFVGEAKPVIEDPVPEASAEGQDRASDDSVTPQVDTETKVEVVAAEPDAANPEAAEIESGITKPVRAVKPSAEAPVGEQMPEPEAAVSEAAEAEAAAGDNASVSDVPEQMAYEEFLKDTNEPIHLFDAEAGTEDEAQPTAEPVAKIDESGDLEIEMDTKNAHVWNELGNVYFNTSAYDDAIVAYSKAIELDRWFAWPYSNLALAYVQKRRFVEAILLYQRSIELFTSDKDKAISWNRLGNVYRRLNDYENAIAAYQRADALDPDNATLSLQSRFSLLGNYAMDPKPSYVS
jgi:tetratricopeptide (TPR) repeat protein